MSHSCEEGILTLFRGETETGQPNFNFAAASPDETGVLLAGEQALRLHPGHFELWSPGSGDAESSIAQLFLSRSVCLHHDGGEASECSGSRRYMTTANGRPSGGDVEARRYASYSSYYFKTADDDSFRRSALRASIRGPVVRRGVEQRTLVRCDAARREDDEARDTPHHPAAQCAIDPPADERAQAAADAALHGEEHADHRALGALGGRLVDVYQPRVLHEYVRDHSDTVSDQAHEDALGRAEALDNLVGVEEERQLGDGLDGDDHTNDVCVVSRQVKQPQKEHVVYEAPHDSSEDHDREESKHVVLVENGLQTLD
ncbi:hypothetical protein ON010_g14612 [Phytophthora cinnamomi]|nr:hypothetical protein ON010_g14612 [Phytophthora cinnamomi]